MEQLAASDVVIHAEADIGEGPVIDHRTGRLVWVDITAGTLIESDVATGAEARTTVPTLLGAVAPRESHSGFAAAIGEGFGFIVDGALSVTDPVLPEPNRRMNDAKVDSRGRMWAGSTHLEYQTGLGMLHCWDGRRASVVVARGFALPNGIGWSPDDRVMYFVDSYAHRLYAAPFDADEGSVGEFHTIARVESGYPDGLAVDVDGFIWLAVWGEHEVHRYNSQGRKVAVVPMPVSQPSSCAFGDDGTLYVTSARSGLSDDQLIKEPLAGSVFALPTDTRGVPVAPFAA